MTATKSRQFKLLLWKTWTLQKRRPIFTLFELMLPIFFAVLLLVIRYLVKSSDIASVTWPPFKIDNMTGPLNPSRYRLLYSPKEPEVESIMTSVQTELTNITVKGFANEDDLLSDQKNDPDSVWAGVIFDPSKNYMTTMPKDVMYTLRVSRVKKEDRWHTQTTFPFIQTVGYRNNDTDGGEPDYFKTGFLSLQYHINMAIMKQCGITPNFNINMQKMPYPSFVEDKLLPTLQQNLPLFLMLGFILTALQTMKNILYEKENKLKEAMKMMGLSSTVYWSSWFLKTLLFLVLSSAIYTLFFTVNIGSSGSVLNMTDPSLLFVYLVVYSLSIIGFCFMMTAFFNKANTGANAGGIIYFVFYVPYFIVYQFYQDMGKSEKMLLSLLNNCGMALGINTIALYEGTGAGAQWSNFHKPATIDDNFSLLESMLMLIVDTVIYFLITWYLDNVKPGDYGVPRPWYFPFTASYWCNASQTSKEYDDIRPLTSNQATFEREPQGLTAGISIKHLRKEFESGKSKKVAVEDMVLNMYEGQITALLGHNGAGKTTTMSMLTGFIPPSKGTAIVNGYDIRHDIIHVRKSLGFCPQHNILFENLTVEEHLRFFAQIKGCPPENVEKEVSEMIIMLGMTAKRENYSKTLSGGQKRKLSVGIALIAGSKIVILDEPSSGMDPAARRETWDILQKSRQGRTLVLTTHFMDEADLLGDRVAIMAEGVLKCCGTSLFLKKAYGAGYHLVIVKDKHCNVANLTGVIQNHIPSAVIESDISAELTYLLPFDQSSKFEPLFEEIGKRTNELGISSFGTSATTMEEVFLKVAEKSEEESREEDGDDHKLPLKNGVASLTYKSISSNNLNGQGSFNDGFVGNEEAKATNGIQLTNSGSNRFVQFNMNLRKNTGATLSMQQFYGMFVKKLIHFMRNRVVTFVQLLLPVLFTIFALMTEKIIPKVQEEKSLPLNFDSFPLGVVVPYANGNPTDILVTNATNAYKNAFSGQYGTREVQLTTQSFTDGLMSIISEIGIAPFNNKYVIGGEFTQSGTNQFLGTAYFNGEPFHSTAISLAKMMDAMFKFNTDDQHSITTNNYPFPRSLAQNTLGLSFATLGTAFIISFDILFGMAFLSTSFIIFLIKERSNGAKHLQKVSGVTSFSYWASSFVWDIINFTFPVLLIMIVFVAFGTEAFTDDHHLGYVFLLFMIYGIACLPFVYLLHYMFTEAATGMVVVTMLNIITGLATTMAVFILKVPTLGTVDISNGLDWVFTIFIPHYCLGQALINFYSNYGFLKSCNEYNYKLLCQIPNAPEFPCCKGNCGDNCLPFTDDYLAWDTPGIGKYFVFMALQCVVCFFLIWLIENNYLYKLAYIFNSNKNSVGESTVDLGEKELEGISDDNDVRDEHVRINSSPISKLEQTDSLIVKNLSKTYGDFRAVKGVSVGVPPQECFGLLGQNGAGKTSTFKMLTGADFVTGGNAYVNGYDIKQNMRSVQQNLGYCPQFDALIAQMSGRETLTMYARLRGVEESQIKVVVNELLDIMMLRKYADRNCEKYSGGNKRKLSTAIALIGDPPFVLLDEPTTGMDPGARRQLWNVLSEVRASGRTLVLTSHSMEECDALCTKIVIMVNGKFVCLGSPQHLKNKFGHGYTLIIRPNSKTEDPVSESNILKNFVINEFPNSKIFDDHQGYLHFQIPDSDVPLSKVFGAMEKAKQNYNIEDYSVHQTTLEQVFLTFTKDQKGPIEKQKKGCCFGCCS